MWGANAETKWCVVHAKGRLSLASGGQQRCRMAFANNLQIQAKSFFAVKNPVSVPCLLHSSQRLVSAAVTSRKWSRTCIPSHDNTGGPMRSRPHHCSDGHLPPSLYRDPSSVRVDSWWTKRHCKHFVLLVFRFYPVSIISQVFLHIHPSTTLYILSNRQRG